MVKSRRARRLQRVKKHKTDNSIEETYEETVKEVKSSKKEYSNAFSRIYDIHYKKLAIIPVALLLFAFVVIGINIATTGDFMNKGVSIKGGVELTVEYYDTVDIVALESLLRQNFPGSDILVREKTELWNPVGIIVEAGISSEDSDKLRSLVSEFIGLELTEENYSLQDTGSVLGAGFFNQTMIAILLAFVFMGLVVFGYFRTLVPSAAVILAAFSDIIVTLAIVDLMGIKIGTAGIAAFLMLIGYSVDTDILLSTRVLKRTEGTVMHRIYGAMKTGLTMNITTIVAVSAALILSDSEIIRQIMTIILIGLVVDIINTWIQNVSILRYYLERRNAK